MVDMHHSLRPVKMYFEMCNLTIELLNFLPVGIEGCLGVLFGTLPLDNVPFGVGLACF